MLRVAEEVMTALEEGRAVVALESTLISHGLPYPHNLAVAEGLEAEVRANGAVPATIGVIEGVPVVGLNGNELERLATGGEHIRKLSRRDVGLAMVDRADGATTVAATMAIAAAAGIEVFATGGIGGVHRGASRSWDVSADLTELGRTPVLVVCAGAKAILDLPATLEYLETQGVPVVGYQTNEFPAFYTPHSGLPVTAVATDALAAARMWRLQRRYRSFAAPGGMLLCVPPPESSALERDAVEAAIARALARAEAEGVRGPAVTPFLLAAMAEETSGESIETNIALLRNNTRVAAEVAVRISELG
ncbi:MAG: pseudouridine-5'-phosphate glycosidase [Chloroflexus sp.]|uniref:pseudouridine-5'-phosphate glycosidase n=1 Tax=Chloroflexus sp. TaxID=1904827 RepID=UPI0021DBF31B|nr:pseudouridine-5'-phosphate glycosidase [Chloroflexus sp.]GIV88210.1 MAG: pseudouridine-5'-phosphate glycosidase [Chloroflexus sp.]